MEKEVRGEVEEGKCDESHASTRLLFATSTGANVAARYWQPGWGSPHQHWGDQQWICGQREWVCETLCDTHEYTSHWQSKNEDSEQQEEKVWSKNEAGMMQTCTSLSISSCSCLKWNEGSSLNVPSPWQLLAWTLLRVFMTCTGGAATASSCT